MGNPMDYFQAGQKAGKARAFPAGQATSNVMDVFNKQLENQMILERTAALFKGEKDYEIQNMPTQQEASMKVGIMKNVLGGGGGDSSTSNDISKPSQGAGILSGNKLTKMDVGGMTIENRGAEVQKNVAQDQLKNSLDNARGSALMMEKLDDLRTTYEKAMGNLKNRASIEPNDNALTSGIKAMKQKGEIALQGGQNVDWQNYQNAVKNFSFSADRGLFGEKGKLISQQLNAGIQMFPNDSTNKQLAEKQWGTLYGLSQKTIDNHNQFVKKMMGDGSGLEVQTNSNYGKINQIKQDAMDAIAKGAPYDKVAAKYKNMTGEDLNG